MEEIKKIEEMISKNMTLFVDGHYVDKEELTKAILQYTEKRVLEGMVKEFKHARKIILMFPERVAEYCADREEEIKETDDGKA